MENRLKIQLEPRYVKEEGDLRVFQKKAIETIKDSSSRLIEVEAPVGAGKSYIIRRLVTDDSLQRIGRVGRMDKGFVYLFVNSRDTFNCLKDGQVFDRDLFESILQDTLPDPITEMIGGELFRGESYNFILIDRYLDNPVVYSEAIFSMYEIDESRCKHFYGDDREKVKILKDVGIRDERLINELILRNKLFPIWGIVISDGLKDTYDRVLKVEKEEKPKGITVYIQSLILLDFVFIKRSLPLLAVIWSRCIGEEIFSTIYRGVISYSFLTP